MKISTAVKLIARIPWDVPRLFLFAFRVFWKDVLHSVKQGKSFFAAFAEDAIETLLFSSSEGKFFVEHNFLPEEKRKAFQDIQTSLGKLARLMKIQFATVSSTLDIQLAIGINLEELSKASDEELKEVRKMVDVIYKAGGKIQRVDQELDSYEIIIPNGEAFNGFLHKPKSFFKDLLIFLVFVFVWFLAGLVLACFDVWGYQGFLAWSLIIAVFCPFFKAILVFLPRHWNLFIQEEEKEHR
ncbi:MAG: hypothetical protein ISN29_12570 [Gammaproteobacteria bacterium AqS3]|nr:hypothetical protein [Gammaproteobacteria bacterium AqS3]